MKILLVMRHAKSSRDNPDLADHQRPLNDRGQKTAPLMGQILKQKALVPKLIISSSARRAQETAQLVAAACGYPGKIETSSEFYATDPKDYLKGLESVEDQIDILLIIGHNPGMESLVEQLTGRHEPFPTAAIAHFELPILRWKDVKNMAQPKLKNLWRPKELD